jgi:hypothetical protein
VDASDLRGRPVIRVELGEEVDGLGETSGRRHGKWHWRVEALALEGYSRQPLLDACREIQRVGGAADDQQIGLFRPGRETPSPRSPDFSKISDLLTHRFQTASARFWGACPLRKTARALQTPAEKRTKTNAPDAARRVAANSRRWWHNSAMALNMALPNDLFKRLGVPKLAS